MKCWWCRNPLDEHDAVPRRAQGPFGYPEPKVHSECRAPAEKPMSIMAFEDRNLFHWMAEQEGES